MGDYNRKGEGLVGRRERGRVWGERGWWGVEKGVRWIWRKRKGTRVSGTWGKGEGSDGMGEGLVGEVNGHGT